VQLCDDIIWLTKVGKLTDFVCTLWRTLHRTARYFLLEGLAYRMLYTMVDAVRQDETQTAQKKPDETED